VIDRDRSWLENKPGANGPYAVRHAGAAPDAYAPDGSEIRLLLTNEQGATRASVCEVRLPAGEVSQPVSHRTVEECWYVLSGSGEVWRCPPEQESSACPPVSVSPGDALVIPTGWHFQFRAASGSDLRFLCFTSPPWPGAEEAAATDVGGLGPPTVR
jgi:mannose-6-phosphate isomerase-like protein (cupin superfamily)